MNLFKEVKAAVTTRQAADHYGIKVNRAGMACCPFHDDRTPSMKVDRNFICFGCQEKGDVIRFTARLFDLTPKEAAIKLIDDFGLSIPVQEKGKWPPAKARHPDPCWARMKLLEQSADRMYGVYCDYLHLLNDWKIRYAPKSPEYDWHPLFVEACQKTDYVEYLLDCLFDGAPEDKAMILIEKKRRLKRLRNELENLSPEKLMELDRALDELQGPIPIEELKEMLDVSDKGAVLSSRRNCTLIFRHDPNLRGRFRYNILAQNVYVNGTLPWERKDKGNALANSDLRAMHLYVEDTYGIKNAPTMDEALELVADENQYHPVRDYLNSLPPWDQVPRVRYALHHFLGADDSGYTYELLKFFMLGAIARAFQPGVKFDYMLCLVGGQGVGKSSFFRFLCTNDEWFCDDLKNLEANDVYEKLQGHWIIEMSEMMAAINAKTNEAIKSFLSRQKETYRIRYDKLSEDRLRQCVFAGTTNKMFFLPNDRTGNRRFLPIDCHDGEAEVHILEDEKASRAYFDQMWAEVMEIWNQGNVRLKLPPELEAEIREHQQMFVAEDVDAGLILAFMQETKSDRICSKMLFKEALHNEFVQPQRWQTNEICETVNQLIKNGKLKGWRYFSNPKRFPGTDYGSQRGWEKIPVDSKPAANKEAVNKQLTLMEGFKDLDSDVEVPFDTG